MADHTHGLVHVHGTPKKDALTYTGILAALLVLTFITVGASYVQFGSGFLNVIIAIGIASIKASLVALFFMHLRHDKPINAIIFLVSVFFLGLFLISTYTDWAERDPLLPSNYKITTAPPATVPAGSPATTPPAH